MLGHAARSEQGDSGAAAEQQACWALTVLLLLQGVKVNSKGKEMQHGTRLYSIASTRYGDAFDGQTTSLCVRRATFWDNEKGAEDPGEEGPLLQLPVRLQYLSLALRAHAAVYETRFKCLATGDLRKEAEKQGLCSTLNAPFSLCLSR